MIKIDYNFTRNQGNKIERFSPPPIVKNITSNIILLEAPNGSGKSTLLNILAVGLYGNRIEKTKCHVSSSIRERMNDLIDSSNHELTFSFTIEAPDKRKTLISSKVNSKTRDIEVYEIADGNKSILTDVTFPQKYYFIYDIPENPLKRLPHLIQQIRSQQSTIGSRVVELTNSIHGLLTEIKESKDPNRIAELTKNIQELNNGIREKNQDISDNETLLKKLTFYQALKFSRHYLRVKDNLEFQIEQLTSKIGNIGRNKKRKNTQYENQKQSAVEIFENINNTRGKLLPIIENVLQDRKNKKIKEYLRYLEQFDPYQMLNDFTVDTKFCDAVQSLCEELKTKRSDKHLVEISEKVKFYGEILNLLKIYEDQNFSIPGINKTLRQLIEDIEEEKTRDSKFVIIIENYQKSIEYLDSLNEEMGRLPEIFLKLQKLSSKIKEYKETNGDYDSLNETLNLRQRDYQTTLTKIANYSQILLPDIDLSVISIEEITGLIDAFEQNNKDQTPFFHFTEDQLSNEINKLNTHINTILKKIETDEQIRDKYQKDLEAQEKKEPHHYQAYYKELEIWESKCQKLERIIRNDFNNYLNHIEAKHKPKDEEERKFYQIISAFLAKQLGEIPYIDETIKPGQVDLINQQIIDETGERYIPFSAISTGQGICIYLKSLLNLPQEDPRKIIAFFDEIATMDSKSLNYILEDLKELNRKNRLLCAILVQKSDDLKIHNVNGD